MFFLIKTFRLSGDGKGFARGKTGSHENPKNEPEKIYNAVSPYSKKEGIVIKILSRSRSVAGLEACSTKTSWQILNRSFRGKIMDLGQSSSSNNFGA